MRFLWYTLIGRLSRCIIKSWTMHVLHFIYKFSNKSFFVKFKTFIYFWMNTTVKLFIYSRILSLFYLCVWKVEHPTFCHNCMLSLTTDFSKKKKKSAAVNFILNVHDTHMSLCPILTTNMSQWEISARQVLTD